MSKKEKVSKEEKIHKRIRKKMGWKLATIVLFAMLLASMFTGGFGDFFLPSKLSKQEAGEQAINYINDNLLQAGIKATLKSISEEGGIYKLIIEINGEPLIDYMTKDGRLLPPGEGWDITEEMEEVEKTATGTTTSVDIPKTDKPIVEAFVFSYCPYGLQFQKALLPVYKLLKNKADIVLIAIGAMHGEYEKQESLRQVCIQEKYSKDKLWDYLEKFMADTKIGSCRGDMKCSDPLVEQIMTQLSIDKDTINDCMVTDAEGLYTSQNSQARGLGISGSPSFVLNGEKIQVGRSSEAIKEAICSAFNNPPDECEQTLSTTQAAPGFGSGTSTSSGSC